MPALCGPSSALSAIIRPQGATPKRPPSVAFVQAASSKVTEFQPDSSDLAQSQVASDMIFNVSPSLNRTSQDAIIPGGSAGTPACLFCPIKDSTLLPDRRSGASSLNSLPMCQSRASPSFCPFNQTPSGSSAETSSRE